MLGKKYANISGQKLEDNQDICICTKYLPLRYLRIIKGKIIMLQGESRQISLYLGDQI